MISLENKICLVTGASDGIGKAIALKFAEDKAIVWIHGRSISKTTEVCEWLKQQTGNPNIHMILGDFSDLESVRKMGSEFLQKNDRLDVLVNNAGGIFKRYSTGTAGIEKSILVNHLAPFLLTGLLMPLMQKDHEALIINMSSNAHYKCKMNFDSFQEGPNSNRRYRGFRAYQQSKLANVMFTYALQKRLQGTCAETFAMHPGLVATHFAHSEYLFVQWALHYLKYFFTHPRKVALDVMRTIRSPESPGKFFFAGKEKRSSSQSYQESEQEALWQLSENLVNFTYSAPVTPWEYRSLQKTNIS